MPYILNTPEDTKEMLKVIGVSSIDELYTQIPSQIKLNESLNLPEGLSEFEVKKALSALSKKNNPIDKFNSFLGAGCYDHYIPAPLAHILSYPQFLTAYTPYQPECSQGILQAIYEYQTYMCLLTGMEVSNASLLDGASSLAEAVLMSLRITKRKKIIITSSLHPEYKDTLNTYLTGFDFTIEEVSMDKDGLLSKTSLIMALDDRNACCVLQSPNFFGIIENVKEVVDMASKKGALIIMVTNPLSLAILKEPAALGVDIVCGDGASLGSSLNFGGSSFGFLAARKDYLRQMPGRLVGKTVDKSGKDAYCFTLQAREQHIRREKATSNICSNQSLNAIGSAIYLSLLGKDGIKEAALHSFSNAQYLYKRLKEIRRVNIPFSPHIFNEFIWQIKDAKTIMKRLYEKNIIAGYCLGKNYILTCCTEKKTKEDIDNFVNTLGQILYG